MNSMAPPPWLAYPRSSVDVRFTPNAERGELSILGNAQGLASLAGVFLWLAAFSDYTGLSISGLPFVRPEGSLALSIVMALESQAFEGRVVKADKDRQFEWHLHDEKLQEVALSLHRMATSRGYDDYLTVNVSPESDASLRFEVTDFDEQS